ATRSARRERSRCTMNESGKPFSSRCFAMPCPMRPRPMKPMRGLLTPGPDRSRTAHVDRLVLPRRCGLGHLAAPVGDLERLAVAVRGIAAHVVGDVERS